MTIQDQSQTAIPAATMAAANTQELTFPAPAPNGSAKPNPPKKAKAKSAQKPEPNIVERKNSDGGTRFRVQIRGRIDGKAILHCWVRGDDVAKIGPQNMRVVEEAFTYRLVWALEALRVRRMSHGWSPEMTAGGAAAAIETGVPQFMMAMLIRAGLPSRSAAMAAIVDTKPVFVTPAEMRAWLESDEITAYTDAGDWPTPETAALWARFRTEALSGGIPKWSVERYTRLLDNAATPPAGYYRIVTAEGGGPTWLATPDYQRIAVFKKSAVDPKPSLFSGRLPGNSKLVEALRIGRGKLRWPRAD